MFGVSSATVVEFVTPGYLNLLVVLSTLNFKFMVKNVVNIILNSNNEVLLLKRFDYDRTYPSIYCLPGGKLNDNELPPVGMIREVYEETGIKIREYTQYKIVHDICFYITKMDYENVKLSNEHESYLITSDINNIPLGPVTKKVLKEYYENFPSKI